MTAQRRAGLAVAAGLVLVAAYYVVALELGAHTFFGASAASVYNRLGESLLHGRLSLDVPVPHGLLALRDPYDPVANRSFREAGLHDYSLYHGHIYAYWGVVPAALLYLPAHAVGLTLADGHVVLLFVLGVLLASTALVALLVRRLMEPPSPVAAFAGVVALGFANLAPFLLSRPVQYEVAIAAGDFFAWLAALCFVAALWSPRRIWLLAAGSLSVGLAVGCRPPQIAALAAAVPALLVVWRAGSGGGRGRALAALAAPCGVVLVALAAYNHARFGSLTEFGTKWQLSDPQYRRGGYFALRAVVPNLWSDLVPPPLARAVFPFLYANPASTSPVHPGPMYGKDAIVGLVWLAPFALLAGMAPRWLRGAPADLRRAVAALALWLVFVLIPLVAINGTTVRLEADWLPVLTAIALIGWLTRLAVGRARGLLVAGALLVAFGAVVTALVSLDNDRVLRSYHRGALRSFESVTGPLSAAASGLAGHPILAAVDDLPTGPPYRYDQLGRDGTVDVITRAGTRVEIAASHAGHVRFEARLAGGRLGVQGAPTGGPPTLAVRRGVTRATLVAVGAPRVRVSNLRVRWAPRTPRGKAG